MAGCVDPGVVDRAHVFAGGGIDLLKKGYLLLEAFLLIIDGRDGWQKTNGAGFVRLANCVEVLNVLELLKLARDRLGLAGVRSRVLLLPSLLQHHVLVLLHLLGEHIEQGFQSLIVLQLHHALESEDSRGRVLLVDRHEALDRRWLVLSEQVGRQVVSGHKNEVIL